MQLANDIKNDMRAAKSIHIPWWGLLGIFLAGLPICWLFDHFEKRDLLMPIACTIFVLAFAIAIKWKPRRHVWFWITMTIVAALHVLLILFVSWPSKWVPALVISGIGAADLSVVLTIVSVIGRLVEGPAPRHRK